MTTDGSGARHGPGPIVTVGHGTLSAGAFADLVVAADVASVVDVRRYPGSRRHPHFGAEAMRTWLADRGVGYTLLVDLGGRRRLSDSSENHGWWNKQFRAYADYMQTDEFAAAVGDLVLAAQAERVAVMCSESVWWRCHRRLLADYLELVQGIRVEHLFHDGRRNRHSLTAGHVVDGRVLRYPGEGIGGSLS